MSVLLTRSSASSYLNYNNPLPLLNDLPIVLELLFALALQEYLGPRPPIHICDAIAHRHGIPDQLLAQHSPNLNALTVLAAQHDEPARRVKLTVAHVGEDAGLYDLDGGLVLVYVFVEVAEAEVALRGRLTVDVRQEEEHAIVGQQDFAGQTALDLADLLYYLGFVLLLD